MSELRADALTGQRAEPVGPAPAGSDGSDASDASEAVGVERTWRTYRTSGTLADGRDIVYYDRVPDADRDAPDRRDLSRVHATSQMRWDPLFRDYSVIAGHRQDRTYLPPADLCPLCPSTEGRPTEIPSPGYEVAVFENRFPSFSTGSADSVPLVDVPPFRSGPGAGRCEVVCFASEHDTSFARLPVAQARTVIDALADRTAELSAIPTVEYVFCFENRGREIGVTLNHPHGQIYAYPFVPPRFYTAAQAAQAHAERTGGCLQCDLLAAELEDGSRVVVESEHWVGFVPFAARWSYQVRLVPRRHLPDLVAVDGAARDDLATVYLDVLGRFDRLFTTPAPYIAAWQQAPVKLHRDSWHLAAEVITIRRAENKLKYLAGSESAAGVWINDIRPEDAAARLREAGNA